jgi:hypothetical protein
MYVCNLGNSSQTRVIQDSKIEDMVHMTIEMVYVHWLRHHIILAQVNRKQCADIEQTRVVTNTNKAYVSFEV